MTDAAPLIHAQTLRAMLDEPSCVILDCRHDLSDFAAGRRAFEAGHIPGAQFADIEQDLSGPKTGRNGRHPLPSRQALAKQFGQWGIGHDTHIVAYDAQGGSFAARAWWLARWLGHERVSVLDGGWAAWVQAGLPVSREAVQRAPRPFVARAALVALVDAQAVEARTRDSVLVDARAAQRFSGELEPIDPVAGHIPGAIHRCWQDNLQDPASGLMKPAEQLREAFTELLAGRSPQALIAYCGSGVTACHHILAMSHAGLPGAALYAGSWSEWVADPSRVVALGDE